MLSSSRPRAGRFRPAATSSHIYEAGRAGKPPVDFFADEYRLNARIARFEKPYVALIDGIVMGGGVGISFHGSHRLMTENAQFAMPEVGIGFFPDVGASHLLPDLGGSFGMYLALTGNRIRYGDALWSGLATHTIKAQDQAGFLDRLVARAATRNRRCAAFPSRPGAKPTGRHWKPSPAISRSRRCATSSAAWSAPHPQTRSRQRRWRRSATRSPTSLHVAWREISAGLTLSMDECMRMEFRILNRMLAGHDFYEGIRAAIIDKGSTPQWRPAGLDDVSAADVDAYFAPLGERELEL